MRDPKFTKGPWHKNKEPIKKWGLEIVSERRLLHVTIQSADSEPCSREELEATADLITASPNLYAVCEAQERFENLVLLEGAAFWERLRANFPDIDAQMGPVQSLWGERSDMAIATATRLVRDHIRVLRRAALVKALGESEADHA